MGTTKTTGKTGIGRGGEYIICGPESGGVFGQKLSANRRGGRCRGDNEPSRKIASVRATERGAEKQTQQNYFSANGRGRKTSERVGAGVVKRQANNFIRRVTVARRNIAAIATRDTIYAAVFSLLARRL